MMPFVPIFFHILNLKTEIETYFFSLCKWLIKRLGIYSTLVGGRVVALAKGCIKLLKK